MNPIIRKIEKLFRVAADQEGKPEGDTAARLASRMMAAHAIEMADINVSERIDDPLEKQTHKHGASVWRRNLSHVLAKHCNCTTSYYSRQGFGTHITWYGHKSDIEVSRYLYDICERQISAASKQHLKGLPEWYDRGLKRREANAFRRSAVNGLSNRLYEIRQEEAAANESGTALVLTRKAKVDAWIDENFSFGKGRHVKYSHSSAGYQAGHDVNLHAGVRGSSRSNNLLSG
tara:strand:- start:347 stop:1042 length:696 start_codon:yes stop_codon:yes gene_type:complete